MDGFDLISPCLCAGLYEKDGGRFGFVSRHKYFCGHPARYLYALPGSRCNDRSQCHLGCHRFIHAWSQMAYTKLTPHQTPGASVEEISPGTEYRLMIPAGRADKYRLAQLDDYTQTPRGRFPLRFPPSTSLRTGLNLSLSARASSDSIPGTWGFGLWNDPFGFSLGFGGNPFRLPALPNAVWFFGASKESYLSFRDAHASPTGFVAFLFLPSPPCGA